MDLSLTSYETQILADLSTLYPIPSNWISSGYSQSTSNNTRMVLLPSTTMTTPRKKQTITIPEEYSWTVQYKKIAEEVTNSTNCFSAWVTCPVSALQDCFRQSHLDQPTIYFSSANVFSCLSSGQDTTTTPRPSPRPRLRSSSQILSFLQSTATPLRSLPSPSPSPDQDDIDAPPDKSSVIAQQWNNASESLPKKTASSSSAFSSNPELQNLYTKEPPSLSSSYHGSTLESYCSSTATGGDQRNYGCKGGDVVSVIKEIQSNPALLMPSLKAPPSSTASTCQPALARQALNYRMFDFSYRTFNVTLTGDPQKDASAIVSQRQRLCESLLMNGPFVAGFHRLANFTTASNFYSAQNPSGVYLEMFDSTSQQTLSQLPDYMDEHVVVVEGFQTATVAVSLLPPSFSFVSTSQSISIPCWVARNSWGAGWNNNGFFLMPMFPINLFSQFDALIYTDQITGRCPSIPHSVLYGGGCVTFHCLGSADFSAVRNTTSIVEVSVMSISIIAALACLVVLLGVLSFIFYFRRKGQNPRNIRGNNGGKGFPDTSSPAAGLGSFQPFSSGLPIRVVTLTQRRGDV